MSEHDEQVAVVDWCAWSRIPCFAIPNGGLRGKAEAARLKAEGVKAGVPDLCIPIARGGYHGLFIEMKFGRNKPTDEQMKWLSTLERNGYMATVCWGAEEAIAVIEQYAKGHLRANL